MPETPEPTINLTIVLPCYNERESVAKMLNRLAALPSQLTTGAMSEPACIEVIVVDDASTDDSVAILRAHVTNWNTHGQNATALTIIEHATRKGYGAALKAGFLAARGNTIAFLDMDMTYDPLDIKDLTTAMKNKNTLIACGTRLSQPSSIPWLRHCGNRFYVAVIAALFGRRVNDACTGLRAFDRRLLPYFLEIATDQLDYSLAMTLVCLRQNWSFSEVPISYGHRAGQSKLKIVSDGLRFLMRILKYRFA